MNLPNKITLFRIALIPLFAIFALAPIPYGDIWAALIFAIAAASDVLDGKIARSQGLVTNFGKFADPLADKMLVCTALICLVSIDRLAAWIVIIILAREFIVDGLRLLAVEKGVVIAASNWGKLKTLCQMSMVVMLLLSSLAFWPQPLYDILTQIIVYLALALTILSGYFYLYKGWKFIK